MTLNQIPSSLQELPAQSAHFCLAKENFIHKELGIDLQGKRLLLSLSAGVDSTSLLLFAHLINDRWKLQIYGAHLNHKLRPQSDKEAESIHKLCLDMGIPCFIRSSHVAVYARKMKIGLEEAGRIMRYRFLSGMRKKLQADLLLTAHHLNDLAEDVIMRLLRGTGWPALSGMSALEAESRVLRPFILTPKKELVDFVKSLDISWREDDSNWDQSYLRNRVRLLILPAFIRENPNFLENIKQLWKQGQVDQDFWTARSESLKNKEIAEPEGISIDDSILKDLHQAERLRWYKDILQRIGPGQVLAHNLFQLDNAWKRRAVGSTFQFPGHKRARILRQRILFYLEHDKTRPLIKD